MRSPGASGVPTGSSTCEEAEQGGVFWAEGEQALRLGAWDGLRLAEMK